jgi:hypothetical protein
VQDTERLVCDVGREESHDTMRRAASTPRSRNPRMG